MVYTWGPVAEAMEGAVWVPTSVLRKFVRDLNRVNFSVVADRQRFYEMMDRLPEDAPFAREDRFPNGHYYITDYDPEIATYLRQLRSAAGYRDFQKDQADKQKAGGDSEKDRVNGAAYNDAQRSFEAGRTGLGMAMTNPHMLWMRKKFEDFVIWHNAQGGGGSGSGGVPKP